MPITHSPSLTPIDSIPALFEKAKSAQRSWSHLSIKIRVQSLLGLRGELTARKQELAELIATEMGKPVSLGLIEIDRTVDELSYLLENAAEWLQPENAVDGVVHYDPLGVIAVISPWNFPFLLPLRAIVPALLTGNTVMFKPSELTPDCGVELASMVRRSLEFLNDNTLPADARSNLFQLVLGGKEHGKALVQTDVELIAFTGSTAAGKWIAAEAAKRLKRLVLELGGLDAAIVLSDADIPSAAKGIVQANAQNSGQVCNAVKRVFVERSAFDSFLEEAVKASRSLRTGDPLTDVDLGPLASDGQLERVKSFISDALSQGAVALTGNGATGELAENENSRFFPHTVLTDVRPSMRIMSEECFGPVLPVAAFDSVEEAIELANATRFGLTASVWSSDPHRAKQIANELHVGTVSINSHRAGPPGTPWGGAKESGLGRMKTRDGLREFTNIKFIR